ncbi:MAG: hypothetical protein D084_Lepto4C00654G0002 [Leptospirillum sp. Group IV 'UBA BS']|nr:MAG: hypothetical protein D084_Lepto4C00654G0002 [Leptospirillum sp. Group IV 'UBA BS']
MIPVPFFDLTRQYATMEKEVLDAALPLFKSQQFILGPAVSEFESQFASTFGLSRAVGVSSGTDALVLSLIASGLLPGQGVLVPSFTFFASASAISLAGGVPVFLDVEPSSFLLTPEILDRFLREETRPGPGDRPLTRHGNHPLAGVMAVHLYGQMVDMEGLYRVARSHGLWIVEDACQSVGARHADRPPGLFSNAAAYSFFPTKNLGGAGDGGMVTTENPAFAEHLLRLRVHGSRKRYEHEEMGYNARLDALQARVLSVKLPRLGEWTERRRELARRYNEAFRDLPGSYPRPCSSLNASMSTINTPSGSTGKVAGTRYGTSFPNGGSALKSIIRFPCIVRKPLPPSCRGRLLFRFPSDSPVR